MGKKKDLFKEAKPLVSKEEFDKLIIENRNFAYKIVQDEFSKYPFEIKKELNSAALEGLIYAATKYDPARADECKFISYAVHTIRYYIYEEIRKLYPVKFNQNFVSKRKKVMKTIEKYKKDHNDEMPSIEYISSKVDMSQKVVQNILNVNNGENFTFLSFNNPTETKESESESLNESKLVKDYLDSALDVSFESKVEVNDILEVLKERVPEKDYNIFYDYFIMGDNFSELAKKYDLKFASSVAYLIKKCLNKCREFSSDAQ